ncbi:MAG: hypothetical protein JJU05_16825 [Verrucomicrobia bacterium]|nr:hypothetical protein [Verrucomicrobiota bacterium]MCH8528822.1 hypothetical protein [Kiritimatiellia bacterium]
MNNPEPNDWSDVSDEDLEYIIEYDPNKKIVQAAKAEKKRRQPPTLSPDQINPRRSETASRMEIVGIHLSFCDWFKVMFKAYLALLCVIFILSIPLLLFYWLIVVALFGALQ